MKTGKEEAYYGWIAMNYEVGIFRNRSMSPTLGLLELGGPSLQVVTEVDGLEKMSTCLLQRSVY